MQLPTLTFKATHTYMCVRTYMFVGGSAFCRIDRCLPEQAVARAVFLLDLGSGIGFSLDVPLWYM